MKITAENSESSGGALCNCKVLVSIFFFEPCVAPPLLPAQSQKLKTAISYSELCEKRVQELAPGLPVTQDCLEFSLYNCYRRKK